MSAGVDWAVWLVGLGVWGLVLIGPLMSVYAWLRLRARHPDWHSLEAARKARKWDAWQARLRNEPGLAREVAIDLYVSHGYTRVAAEAEVTKRWPAGEARFQ